MAANTKENINGCTHRKLIYIYINYMDHFNPDEASESQIGTPHMQK